MRLTDLEKELFPYYHVYTLKNDGVSWQRFTIDPLETKVAVERIVNDVRSQYPNLPPERIGVRVYTIADWRKDLIDTIMDEEDCVRRALSVFRTETLCDILKE